MDMKAQRFGIEIEMTGITRENAAKVAAEYFGTSSRYLGAGYDTYAALDTQGRQWKFMSDASITPQRKNGRRTEMASDSYKTEMVSPICTWEDIEKVQELVRKLKTAGAITNKSCGIHVHIDASPFDANSLRNITNIMAAKEDLIYKALEVSVARQHRWCRPVEQRFLDELNRQKPRSLDQVKRIWYDGGDRSSHHYDDSRYHCLNLHSVFQKRHGGIPVVQRYAPRRKNQGIYPALSGDWRSGAQPAQRQPHQNPDHQREIHLPHLAAPAGADW